VLEIMDEFESFFNWTPERSKEFSKQILAISQLVPSVDFDLKIAELKE
jgi:hypothetical protein